MAQITQGLVSVTNGSEIVSGTGTSWLDDVEPTNEFTVAADGVLYTIASVDSDTQITLSAPYVGDTATDVPYAIVRDFTQDGFALLNQGDIETATVFTRSMQRIQTRFNQVVDAEQEVQEHSDKVGGVHGVPEGEEIEWKTSSQEKVDTHSNLLGDVHGVPEGEEVEWKSSAQLKVDEAEGQRKFRQELLERIERDATLNLDFANNVYRIHEGIAGGNNLKLYEQLVTHNRLSSATGFSGIGKLETVTDDVKRLVYSPETGRSEGLLVEGEGENLYPWSKDITQWNFNNNIDAEMVSGVYPGFDVGLYSIPASSSGTSARAGISDVFASTQESGRVVKFVVKPLLSASDRFDFGAPVDANTSLRWFLSVDPATGDVISTSGGISLSDVSSRDVGFGFFEYSISLPDGVELSRSITCMLRADNSDSNTALPACYFLHVSASVGGNVGSYIPTTGTPATRAPDVVSVGDVGKWLSGLVSYTIAGQVRAPEHVDVLAGVFDITSQAGSNFPSEKLSLDFRADNTLRWTMRAGGVTSFAGSSPPYSGEPIRFVMVITPARQFLCVNGSLVINRDSNAGVPDSSQFAPAALYRRQDGTGQLNSTAQEFLVDPYALTEAEAIEASKL